MKLNWGTGIAIAYTAFALTMIALVIKASKQNNDLVTKDYYNKAVNYQQQIDAEQRGASQGIQLRNNINSKQIEVTYPADFLPSKGSILFYKPDNAALDFNVEMQPGNNSTQIIETVKMARGKWNIKCSWQQQEKNYFFEQSIFMNND
ncbi:MAG TPA: FixH family protein [Bacteroidia bacterium]|nr:FixH family protein [Bacteroidia bacterium]HNU34859.1 FixH family protein [Bacteroidia bacterium]